jgi:hypothetical protein
LGSVFLTLLSQCLAGCGRGALFNPSFKPLLDTNLFKVGVDA